jgi:hypothetical protein
MIAKCESERVGYPLVWSSIGDSAKYTANDARVQHWCALSPPPALTGPGRRDVLLDLAPHRALRAWRPPHASTHARTLWHLPTARR